MEIEVQCIVEPRNVLSRPQPTHATVTSRGRHDPVFRPNAVDSLSFKGYRSTQQI